MITLNEIKKKQLSTVSRGYDINETNAFLNDIAESYAQMEAENKELYRKLEILAAKIEEYRDEEDSIKTVLLTAQRTADKLTKSAKDKAEEIIAESTETAHNAVMTAKEKAEKLVSEARDYAAALTKEKTEAADEIIGEAEQKANDAISGAKIVAKDILDQVKELSSQLVSKAKEEKEYHENIISSLKSESNNFKSSLVSLYETQLSKLHDMISSPEEHEQTDTEEKLSAVEEEINGIFSEMKDIEDLVKVKINSAQADDLQETENEITETADENEVQKTDEATEYENETAEEINDFEFKEISDENLEKSTEISEEPESEVDVNSAIDAFSNSSEASQETVDESNELPFESFFNVKNSSVRTDEKISLIPPDDFVIEEDDNAKNHGFFKKKKKK